MEERYEGKTYSKTSFTIDQTGVTDYIVDDVGS
jgi:hypothetical protein